MNWVSIFSPLRRFDRGKSSRLTCSCCLPGLRGRPSSGIRIAHGEQDASPARLRHREHSEWSRAVMPGVSGSYSPAAAQMFIFLDNKIGGVCNGH